jgi:hypothetical protein
VATTSTRQSQRGHQEAEEARRSATDKQISPSWSELVLAAQLAAIRSQ